MVGLPPPLRSRRIGWLWKSSTNVTPPALPTNRPRVGGAFSAQIWAGPRRAHFGRRAASRAAAAAARKRWRPVRRWLARSFGRTPPRRRGLFPVEELTVRASLKAASSSGRPKKSRPRRAAWPRGPARHGAASSGVVDEHVARGRAWFGRRDSGIGPGHASKNEACQSRWSSPREITPANACGRGNVGRERRLEARPPRPRFTSRSFRTRPRVRPGRCCRAGSGPHPRTPRKELSVISVGLTGDVFTLVPVTATTGGPCGGSAREGPSRCAPGTRRRAPPQRGVGFRELPGRDDHSGQRRAGQPGRG